MNKKKVSLIFNIFAKFKLSIDFKPRPLSLSCAASECAHELDTMSLERIVLLHFVGSK